MINIITGSSFVNILRTMLQSADYFCEHKLITAPLSPKYGPNLDYQATILPLMRLTVNGMWSRSGVLRGTAKCTSNYISISLVYLCHRVKYTNILSGTAMYTTVEGWKAPINCN